MRMTRTIGARCALVASLCLLSGFVEAAAAQAISVGPRLGVNLSRALYREPNVDNQLGLRTGMHLGVSGALDLSRHFSVEGSLLYGQGGYERLSGIPGNQETDYVELPVLVRVRWPLRVSPHLALGLAPRFEVRCRLTEVATVGETSCGDPMVGNGWRTFDVGAVGGLGAGIVAGGGVLVLEVRLSMGLRDMKSEALPPGSARNIGLQFTSAFLKKVR